GETLSRRDRRQVVEEHERRISVGTRVDEGAARAGERVLSGHVPPAASLAEAFERRVEVVALARGRVQAAVRVEVDRTQHDDRGHQRSEADTRETDSAERPGY